MSTNQTYASEVQNTGPVTKDRSSPRKLYGVGSTRNLYANLQKKVSRLQILAWSLGGLVLIVTVIWVMTSLKLTARSSDLLLERGKNRELETRLEKLQADNESLGTEVENLRNELAHLVKGRIPQLLPLEFGITIPIEQSYFRNVSFTLAGTSEDAYYEYHAVLHNNDTRRVVPDVTLRLFDKLGVQVGESHLSNKDDTSGSGISELEPGETRSYYSQIELGSEVPAKYFLVDIQ
jgi:cell division protein FtsB